MKSIINGHSVKEARFFDGCFTFELDHPINDKKFGVINYTTKGRNKLYHLTTGDCLSIEATYVFGVDAILITEIL